MLDFKIQNLATYHGAILEATVLTGSSVTMYQASCRIVVSAAFKRDYDVLLHHLKYGEGVSVTVGLPFFDLKSGKKHRKYKADGAVVKKRGGGKKAVASAGPSSGTTSDAASSSSSSTPSVSGQQHQPLAVGGGGAA